MESDEELLRRFVSGDQAAFTALVQRHLNLLYRSALRRVGGNGAAAEEVTQRVFTSLARKARTLQHHPSLVGWLHTSVRFAAAEFVRAERRRRHHEQEAHMFDQLNSPEPDRTKQIEPVLDDVLEKLGERDRHVLLLHFFEGLSFVEVARLTRSTADATRMRVNRTLERLRVELQHRGIASTSAVLATTLAAQALPAATLPPAAAIAHHALHAATVATHAGWTTLGAHAARIWAVAGAGVVVLLIVGGALLWRERPTPPVPATAVAAAAPAAAAPSPAASADREPNPAPPDPAVLAPGPGTGLPDAAVPAVLSASEWNLLATLWQLQRRSDDHHRTVLSVGAAAPNRSGIAPLAARGLVEVRELPADRRSVRLTNEGLAFCRANRDVLDHLVPVENLR